MEEAELKRIKIHISSLVIVERQAVDANWISANYRENFGESIPFSKFGAHSLENFLTTQLTDRLDSFLDAASGRRLFRAKSVDATAHILNLVQKQKKKKKSKGTKQKGTITRGSSKKSPLMPRLACSSSRVRASYGSASVRGHAAAYPVTKTTVDPSRSCSGIGRSKGKGVEKPFAASTSRFDESAIQCADRILQALLACGEAAWHSRLSEAYTRLFGHPLTGRVLDQHFGTRNISTIVWQHLRGRVLVECYIDENSFYLTTPAAAKRKIEEARRDSRTSGGHESEGHFQPCISPPTPAKLMAQLTAMLVDCYPTEIPLDSLARRHASYFNTGCIDPDSAYSQSWTQLLIGPLQSRFTIHPATNSLHLKESYVKACGIVEKKARELDTITVAAGAMSLTDAVVFDVSESVDHDDDDESDDDDGDDEKTTSDEEVEKRSETHSTVQSSPYLRVSVGPLREPCAMSIQLKETDPRQSQLMHQLNLSARARLQVGLERATSSGACRDSACSIVNGGRFEKAEVARRSSKMALIENGRHSDLHLMDCMVQKEKEPGTTVTAAAASGADDSDNKVSTRWRRPSLNHGTTKTTSVPLSWNGLASPSMG